MPPPKFLDYNSHIPWFSTVVRLPPTTAALDNSYHPPKNVLLHRSEKHINHDNILKWIAQTVNIYKIQRAIILPAIIRIWYKGAMRQRDIFRCFWNRTRKRAPGMGYTIEINKKNSNVSIMNSDYLSSESKKRERLYICALSIEVFSYMCVSVCALAVFFLRLQIFFTVPHKTMYVPNVKSLDATSGLCCQRKLVLRWLMYTVYRPSLWLWTFPCSY